MPQALHRWNRGGRARPPWPLAEAAHRRSEAQAKAHATYRDGDPYCPIAHKTWLDALALADREHAHAVREAASNASSERSLAATTYCHSAGYLGEAL